MQVNEIIKQLCKVINLPYIINLTPQPHFRLQLLNPRSYSQNINYKSKYQNLKIIHNICKIQLYYINMNYRIDFGIKKIDNNDFFK